MSSYNILLADDHVMFRHGIRRIIEENSQFNVIGEARDGLELLSICRRTPPHLVILDISMPSLRGIEATHEIKKAHPEVKVLILTMHKDIEYLDSALAAGAEGYILKEDADDELLTAIKIIREGGTYISNLLSTQVAQMLKQRSRCQTVINPMDPLTAREREILKLIAEGKSSKEIAALLFISFRTVQNHRQSLQKKLHIKKEADITKYAIQKGYVSLDG